MKTLALLLAVLGCAPLPANAQETDAPEGAVIELATVSGISFDRLSPGLRQDISDLDGTPLDRAKVDALAARIEEEQPEMVAAVRAVARPDAGARVVFLVARISDDSDLVENINARCVVETVETSGVADADVPQDVRDRLQALVGKPLQADDADRLSDQLRAAFPRYDVKRRISRGSVRGRIRVVFELVWVEAVDSLHGAAVEVRLPRRPEVQRRPRRSDGQPESPARRRRGVHQQGRSDRGVLGLPVASRKPQARHRAGRRLDRVLAIHAGMAGRHAGGAGGQPVRTGTLPHARHRRDDGDVCLQPLRAPVWRRQHFGLGIAGGGAGFHQRQCVDAGSGCRSRLARGGRPTAPRGRLPPAGRRRITGQRSRLQAPQRRRARARQPWYSVLLASLALGYISGQAPLFERFSLGDTSTLRGWNKFDIGPTGGRSGAFDFLEKPLAHVRDLAAYFLSEFCTRNNFRPKAIEDEVVSSLERYEWPGNVRELRNAVERMAILSHGSQITLESVPMEIRSPAAPAERGLQGIRDAAERDRIVHALEQTSWNVSGAARLLGVERTNLHKRIRALGLSRD